MLAPTAAFAFERPPLLEDAETTRNTVQSRSATYYFTLDGREQTGVGLQELVIQQLPSPDHIQFVIAETAVALDTNQLLPIDVSPLLETSHSGVRIIFRQPLAGPYRLRVSLRPVQNPHSSGVYLFEVQARGEKERQLRTLGIARIHFYDAFSRWRR
ncbi:MAG: DUF2808 domain-containing protein [Oscillatoriales cyanobacterium SM2_2_1]|nr:DUF2808 domain-containing protein [Oscillatoriales cyanobacterium SM2_2_1]